MNSHTLSSPSAKHGFTRSLAAVWSAALIVLAAGCSTPSVPGQQVLSAAVAWSAMEAALSREGCPYEYGAQGPDRFDCSGLVVWSYRQAYPALKLRAGEYVGDDASADGLWRYNVERIAASAMRPGDLVFISSNEEWITHTGLFLRWLDEANIEIIDASSAADQQKVVIEPWPTNGLKRGAWFVGAGRLMTAVE